MALVWGLGTAVSRITDFRHFWWDVLVGGTLGVIFAVYTIHISCKSFKSQSSSIPGIVAMVNGNHQLSYESKRNQSVRKLLTSASCAELADNRELSDVATTWTNPS